MKHDVTLNFNGFNFPAKGVYHEPLRNSKEVMQEFGFRALDSLHASIKNKSFPEPDVVTKTTHGKRLHWKLSTLKKERQRRLKSNDHRFTKMSKVEP